MTAKEKIEEIGFSYSLKSNLYERESDDGFYKDFLILNNDLSFHIERELYLQESDGSFYTDYQKIYPSGNITLFEFLKDY